MFFHSLSIHSKFHLIAKANEHQNVVNQVTYNIIFPELIYEAFKTRIEDEDNSLAENSLQQFSLEKEARQVYEAVLYDSTNFSFKELLEVLNPLRLLSNKAFLASMGNLTKATASFVSQFDSIGVNSNFLKVLEEGILKNPAWINSEGNGIVQDFISLTSKFIDTFNKIIIIGEL